MAFVVLERIEVTRVEACVKLLRDGACPEGSSERKCERVVVVSPTLFNHSLLTSARRLVTDCRAMASSELATAAAAKPSWMFELVFVVLLHQTTNEVGKEKSKGAWPKGN